MANSKRGPMRHSLLDHQVVVKLKATRQARRVFSRLHESGPRKLEGVLAKILSSKRLLNMDAVFSVIPRGMLKQSILIHSLENQQDKIVRGLNVKNALNEI